MLRSQEPWYVGRLNISTRYGGTPGSHVVKLLLTDIGFSLSLRGSSGPHVSIIRANMHALDVDSGAIIESDQHTEDEFRHIIVKPGPGQFPLCNITLLNEVDVRKNVFCRRGNKAKALIGRKRLDDKEKIRNAVKNIRIECAVEYKRACVDNGADATRNPPAKYKIPLSKPVLIHSRGP